MKTTTKLITLAGVTLALLAGPARAQFTLLHEFTGSASDGSIPYGSLTRNGSTLYGLTSNGGTWGVGTLFSMNTNGSGFSVLHSFAGGGSDGRYPFSSLTLSGSTLYGMSYLGGASDRGTVYKINTDGTGFSLLHTFAGGGSDGMYPWGGLTLSGSTLYGMTRLGGDSDLGTVFKVNTDGSGFSLLHEFAGGGSDGAETYGDLLLSGSTLYGMTLDGGDSNLGTIFKVNTDGSGYGLLHEFAGGGSDGNRPNRSLILDGATLYGMTQFGGDSDDGTVFQINTDGSGFGLLHEFAGGSNDGRDPFGSLMLDGSTLYGTTRYGGDSDLGTLFQISTNGSGFQLLHEFAGGGNDGGRPYDAVILSGKTLYGMTAAGGDSDLGTVYSFVVPEPSTAALLGAGLAGLMAWRRRAKR
ncbi:MAG: PEP-CTERM sorting domain-containing protein [Verrucomicrobia bacterium]|nr:PEP-CTERM sorting domain-containing protein [Verrucomicrobiota bacterium]